ncbi:hypothetical protein [Nannocystis pusilla]|uniref:Uncharacterized protein n=1 Tax=Nannocystis pusilla TaxID=889268 RepID=A0ABS7TQV5_9BACT|nr:hypothetical protein [Nannocystis pusilla]MBZ5710622.1 hypothetical protein [Nannocystis pusilla]
MIELGGRELLRELESGARGAIGEARTRADLLAITGPHGLAGDVGVGGGRLVMVADDDFLLSAGRRRGEMRPDDQEFVVLQLPPL